MQVKLLKVLQDKKMTRVGGRNERHVNFRLIRSIEQNFIEKKGLKETLEEVERKLLLKAYNECQTTYEMAKYLGISQPTVIYKLKKYKDDFKNL